jgi:hypothetical protein
MFAGGFSVSKDDSRLINATLAFCGVQKVVASQAGKALLFMAVVAIPSGSHDT